jgi:hypothetical protein
LPDVIAPTDEAGMRPKKKREVVPLVRQIVRGKLTYRPARHAEIAEVLVMLGQCRDKRFQRAASTLFKAWPAPILRVRFLHEDEEWKVIQVSLLMLHRLTKRDRNALAAVLREKVSIRVPAARPHEDNLASIAVLFDENDPQKPSTSETMDRLERVGRCLPMRRIPEPPRSCRQSLRTCRQGAWPRPQPAGGRRGRRGTMPAALPPEPCRPTPGPRPRRRSVPE